jgi:hypothetical protein
MNVNAVDAYLYGAGSLRSALSFQTADHVLNHKTQKERQIQISDY